MTRAPGDQPNFFTILGLPPDELRDEAAYARALNEKRNLWSQQRQGIKTQDATGEGQRNLEYLSAIERVMRDPQAREAERLAALRHDGAKLRQGRTVVRDRPSSVSRTRTLPRLPGMSSDSVTRSLCHAVHLDPFLRDYVLHTVVEPHLRAVCPAYGVDLVAVARHAMKAQRRWTVHGYVLLAIRLALVSAVALAVLADWTAALAIACAGLLAAWFNLFWVTRADRLAALRAVTDNTPPADQADPLSQEQEERLRKLDNANVIVYAQGEGDPFVGSGRRLHSYQLTPIDVTRPGHDPAGNVKVIRPFDAVKLHHYLATEVPKVGFGDLHVRNQLYVRGDHASDVAGLLPDQFAAPAPLVRSDWVKSGVNHPAEWARTYICMERIMSGGDLVVSMYVRAWLVHDMLFVERVIYFLPPLRRVYQPTREFAAGTSLSVTINAMGSAARQAMHILGGKWIGRLETSEFGKSARRAEAQARRKIKAGVIHDYGAKTSVREAVAAYDATEHFEGTDILDSAKRLSRRLMDCIKAFLDEYGVDTSDFHDQAQLITTSISNIDTTNVVNAVIGGQGHVITGHGAVNNFGSMRAGV